MRPAAAAIVFGLLVAAILPAPACRADAISFSIRDRLAVQEVAEVTTIYVDDILVRSFRLDSAAPDITIAVTVPSAGTHRYTLCGHILVREADGSIRTKGFAVGGTIDDVVNREFEAYASDNFTRFFLLDTTPGRPPAKIDTGETNACTPAVS
ncbi:MAG: hypothetical protein JOY70_08530 [Acidisphaera sp.]|nr:hypothetical protein [Acidisphaera sp.]